MNWNDDFKVWAKGPSDTEDEKANNAERVICEALEADPKLSAMKVRTYVQGSYRAKTNVRLDSDVDICILHPDIYFYDLTFSDLQHADEPGGKVDLTHAQFKNEVERVLKNRFGAAGVARGNKAFDVHANTFRVHADVVPAFNLRRYLTSKDIYGNHKYEEGIAFLTDGGIRVENWPEQTHVNGNLKDVQTRGRYKEVIRVLKTLRNKMQESNIAGAKDVGSFFIESLVWNVPNSNFNHLLLKDDVEAVLWHIFRNTYNSDGSQKWVEVNERHFVTHTPELRKKADDFSWSALEYIGAIK